MLFNSFNFIFLYVPIVLAGYFALGRFSHRSAITFLAAASLFFYGYWTLKYIPLLLASIAFNYFSGSAISRLSAGNKYTKKHAYIALTIAVSCNLALLGYYKYTAFAMDALSSLLGYTYSDPHIELPLGISFFTFTQIAFLVDVYRGKAHERNIVNYTLFITFFPHLIAGPILHHNQMIPQFYDRSRTRINSSNIAIGLSIFTLGLAKKVLIADQAAPFANAVFSASTSGPIAMFDSWVGALAYTMQLYFDFSGYSDMAIGVSLMLGINIPINFWSPYKATSIIEFWRRWHMTLSTFLRDYLYIPLGGNKHGEARRIFNLFLTMLLGGIWHGAAYTFVIWGALHGILLVLNHLYRKIINLFNMEWLTNSTPVKLFYWAITMFCVIVAWVFFRADSVKSAFTILNSMITYNQKPSIFSELDQTIALAVIAAATVIVLAVRNTAELFGLNKEGQIIQVCSNAPYKWSQSLPWAALLATLFFFGIVTQFGTDAPNHFLYFQF